MKEKLDCIKKPSFLLFTMFIILLLGMSFLFYQQKNDVDSLKKELSELKNTPISSDQTPKTLGVNSEKETEDILSKVSKLMELPTGEKPTIGTLTDLSVVKGQSFFDKAAIGDKLLVYNNAKKAILYRPKDNKIINVANISFQTTPTPRVENQTNITNLLFSPSITPTNPPTPSNTIKPTPTASPTPQSPLMNFQLLNGTKTVGLTKTYEEKELKKLLPLSSVIGRGDSKGNYTESIIVLINISKDNVKDQVAKTLNLPLGQLPDGEVKPKEEVDFLIILGSDKATL